MRFTHLLMSAVAVLSAGSLVHGQAAPVPPAGQAASRIVAITVYQNSALITREVTVPAATGAVELVVGPLPSSTVGTSLFSESNDGLRVLTTRYRTRALEQVAQEDHRRIEQQLKALAAERQGLQRQLSVAQENLRLMGKMEDFTAATLRQLSDKGALNAQAVTQIADYIMKSRSGNSSELTELEQKIARNTEQAQFLERQFREISGVSDKTVREAVIVVDKTVAGAATVKLNYLVSAASWRLQYRLRAAADKPEVQLEYLGMISQQSGEDWNNVALVLSMAQPLFNAAPPELTALEVILGGGAPLQMNAAMPQAKKMRENAKSQMAQNDMCQAISSLNSAAAIEQQEEYLFAREMRMDLRNKKASPTREGQSIAFRLPARLSIPWRADEQLIEVACMKLAPNYFYKAIPVLTEHVYRLATFVNDGPHVILPGEATIYVGSDFVGRTQLPLVAVGESFTAGFGVDPQLQVQRTLVEKTRSNKWSGDQVLKFEYRLAVNSYKSQPVRMEVWDRVPYTEKKGVAIEITSITPDISKDPIYQREQRNHNLLRWDLTVPANVSGEKAMVLDYKFQMEVEKGVAVNTDDSGAAAPARYDLHFEAK